MLATVLMGVGIAFMQTAIPVFAKLWVPGRIGRASAVYTNGLLVGELLAAGATGPLAAAWLGAQWQWAFALWVAPVPLLMLALVVGCRHLPAMANGSRAAGLTLPNVHDGRMWPLIGITLLALLSIPAMLVPPGGHVVWAAGVFGFFTSALFIFVLALPAWLVRLEALPRLMAGMLFFGYLLVFGITVVGGWLNDLSGTVALAFLPTLLISLVAMAVIPRLLVSRQ